MRLFVYMEICLTDDMELQVESIIFFFVLVDAVFAALTAWTGVGEYFNKRYSIFGRYFPITRGWTSYYLILVLWLGSAFMRLGYFG